MCPCRHSTVLTGNTLFPLGVRSLPDRAMAGPGDRLCRAAWAGLESLGKLSGRDEFRRSSPMRHGKVLGRVGTANSRGRVDRVLCAKCACDRLPQGILLIARKPVPEDEKALPTDRAANVVAKI